MENNNPPQVMELLNTVSFPRTMPFHRKPRVIPSLQELAARKATSYVFNQCDRKKFRKGTNIITATEIFRRLWPTNKWDFPCSVNPTEACHFHLECRWVYLSSPSLIRLYFSEDIENVHIDLRKIHPETHEDLFRSFCKILMKLPLRPYPNLKEFIIMGDCSFDLMVVIELLVDVLVDRTCNLEHLHLPVCTNKVLASVAQMEKLRIFKANKSMNVSAAAIFKLASRNSYTRDNLEVLHIGIFRHAHFNAEKVCRFLEYMKKLKEFSFMDTDRMLVSTGGLALSRRHREKVFSYSVLKTAIMEHEKRWPHRKNGRSKQFRVNLESMEVVDRQLRPCYFLESTFKLTQLTIDWQEELRFQPHDRYDADWFSVMIRKDSWAQLSSRLEKLQIIFPSYYSANSYSLPLEDLDQLLSNLPKIKSLTLVGAGRMSPIPIKSILRHCPTLKELIFDAAIVYFPSPRTISWESINHSIERFQLLNDISTLLYNADVLWFISIHMPNLRELEIQPKNEGIHTFSGYTQTQLGELVRLKQLTRLNIILSLLDFTVRTHLSKFVLLLRDFPSLKNLVISWGREFEFLHLITHRIKTVNPWLKRALRDDLPNLRMELSYEHHKDEYHVDNYNSSIIPKLTEADMFTYAGDEPTY